MRSITDPWEVSQDIPNPFEPVKFEVTYLAPYRTAKEYADFINRSAPVQGVHHYDEHHIMPGHYTKAEIINGKVWVTFHPQKIGKYWVSLKDWQQRPK